MAAKGSVSYRPGVAPAPMVQKIQKGPTAGLRPGAPTSGAPPTQPKAPTAAPPGTPSTFSVVPKTPARRVPGKPSK